MVAIAELITGEKLRYFPDKLIGEGSEKEFFLTEYDDLLIGFYKFSREALDTNRIKRLEYVINRFNPTLDPQKSDFWKKHFCWPTSIIVKPKTGILCPRFPKQFYFEDDRKEKKGKWFLSHLATRLPKIERGNFLQRLNMCRHLARAIGRMHMAGLAHSDLSGNNILMNPAEGTCIIIDIDSLVVPKMFPPKVLGTRGYIAPEVVATSMFPLNHPNKKLPCINTDLYSLSVIIYETLLLRHPLEGKKVNSDDPSTDDLLTFGRKALFIENPHDGSNRPENLTVTYKHLGPYLSLLIERAFIDGLHEPDARPSAFEWEDAIIRTLDSIYPCNGPKCWHKWFVLQKDQDIKCPFCGLEIEGLIPVMHLFRRYAEGLFVYDNRYLPVWDGRSIHEWHMRSDIPYPDGMLNTQKEIGNFKKKAGWWFFENNCMDSMSCIIHGKIRHSESVKIYKGQTIQLCKSFKGRVAKFQYLP